MTNQSLEGSRFPLLLGEFRSDYFRVARVADKPGYADKSMIEMFALLLFILAALIFCTG